MEKHTYSDPAGQPVMSATGGMPHGSPSPPSNQSQQLPAYFQQQGQQQPQGYVQPHSPPPLQQQGSYQQNYPQQVHQQSYEQAQAAHYPNSYQMQPQNPQQQYQQSPHHSQQAYYTPDKPNYQQQPQAQPVHGHVGGQTPASAPGQTQYQNAIPLQSLNMSAAPVDCPICHQRKLTQTTPVSGNTTHAWAGVFFCFTLCLCFIPYMMTSLKDVQHRCGNCGTLLATWHKSGQVEIHAHA